jgi:hypothetical protein
MSQRPPVDRGRILDFLQKLGERFRKPGRLWLVGGTTVVFEQFRAQTLDIDVTFEVAPQDETQFLQVIRELKEALSINVEQVSPADFIPLPGGWRERSTFVGRFGSLDVFHFDLYSTALSKIERGNEQDFSDILALLKHGEIELGNLRMYFAEVLPHFGARSLRQNPKRFEENFRALEQLWRDESGGLTG